MSATGVRGGRARLSTLSAFGSFGSFYFRLFDDRWIFAIGQLLHTPARHYLPTVSRPWMAQNAGWLGRTGRVESLLAREDDAPSAVDKIRTTSNRGTHPAYIGCVLLMTKARARRSKACSLTVTQRGV